MNKLLLVTFPVDLGNKTYERRLVATFEKHLDLEVYRFVPNTNTIFSNSKFARVALVGKRFLSAYALWQKVRKAQHEGRKILFHGVSPALFAFPVTIYGSSYIVTDWTRKLYEPILDTSLSPPWLTFIHKKILEAQKCVLGLTDAVIEEIARDYGIPRNKLKKARLPFSYDLNNFIPSPARNDEEVRLLFVGGELYRKGGDVLLNWFRRESCNPNLKLTMVTKASVEVPHPNITILTNVDYGQQQHIELFKNHDVFVLPTKIEGYPSVLGEAACAGLAILTTKNALGAPEIIRHGVNGFICDSQDALLSHLTSLVNDKPFIESMKRKSRELMEIEFAPELVLSDYISCIFENCDPSKAN